MTYSYIHSTLFTTQRISRVGINARTYRQVNRCYQIAFRLVRFLTSCSIVATDSTTRPQGLSRAPIITSSETQVNSPRSSEVRRRHISEVAIRGPGVIEYGCSCIAGRTTASLINSLHS